MTSSDGLYLPIENYGFTPGQTSSMKHCRGFFFSCSRCASHARRRRKPSIIICVYLFKMIKSVQSGKGTAQDTNMLITNSAYIRFEYNSSEQKCGFRKNVSQKY